MPLVAMADLHAACVGLCLRWTSVRFARCMPFLCWVEFYDKIMRQVLVVRKKI